MIREFRAIPSTCDRGGNIALTTKSVNAAPRTSPTHSPPPPIYVFLKVRHFAPGSSPNSIARLPTQTASLESRFVNNRWRNYNLQTPFRGACRVTSLTRASRKMGSHAKNLADRPADWSKQFMSVGEPSRAKDSGQVPTPQSTWNVARPRPRNGPRPKESEGQGSALDFSSHGRDVQHEATTRTRLTT